MKAAHRRFRAISNPFSGKQKVFSIACIFFSLQKKSYTQKMSCKFHCILRAQPHEAVKNVKRDLWMPFLQPTNILHKLLCYVCYVDIQAELFFVILFFFLFFQHNPALWCMILLFNIARDVQKWIFLQACYRA